MTSDDTPLHIGPLPEGHKPEPECSCHPIASEAGRRVIYVHRIAEIPLNFTPPDRR